MRGSQRLFAALALLFAALAATVYWKTPERSAAEALAAGQTLPAETIDALYALRLPDGENREHALSSFRGKTLVVNFWAPWCPPCREEMPILARTQARHAARTQFLGIALDSAEAVRDFERQYPAGYPLLVAGDEGTALARKLGNRALALPYTIVIDANGAIRFVRAGLVTEGELDRVLSAIVGQP